MIAHRKAATKTEISIVYVVETIQGVSAGGDRRGIIRQTAETRRGNGHGIAAVNQAVEFVIAVFVRCCSSPQTIQRHLYTSDALFSWVLRAVAVLIEPHPVADAVGADKAKIRRATVGYNRGSGWSRAARREVVRIRHASLRVCHAHGVSAIRQASEAVCAVFVGKRGCQ